MDASGVLATCLPVRLDDGLWETAFFVRLAGEDCSGDRRTLGAAKGPLPVGFEADVLELDTAAVVVLRLEVQTSPEDPLAAEVLLTPGGVQGHFESLKLLTTQGHMHWFFGDSDCRLLHAQSHALTRDQHDAFAELLRDATAHDALVRLTARYDAAAGLAAVASHYEPRAGGGHLPPPMARGLPARRS